MKNFEVIKKLPLKIFANQVFIFARTCKTLEEFETLLEREFGEGCGEKLKKDGWEALKQIEECFPQD